MIRDFSSSRRTERSTGGFICHQRNIGFVTNIWIKIYRLRDKRTCTEVTEVVDVIYKLSTNTCVVVIVNSALSLRPKDLMNLRRYSRSEAAVVFAETG